METLKLRGKLPAPFSHPVSRKLDKQAYSRLKTQELFSEETAHSRERPIDTYMIWIQTPRRRASS